MSTVAQALVEHEPAQMPTRQIEPAKPMTPMEMVGRALEMGVSAEILKQMMDLRDREEANQARRAFDEAMAAAKAEIPVIIKNREVDFTSQKGRTHYRHEDLAEIARTIDPILARHGLSYRYRVQSPIGAPVSVTCIVSHRSGHSEENTLVGPPDESGNKNQLQRIASTITLLQRYTLKASLGLAAGNDDDGKAAGQSDEEITKITEEQAGIIRALIDETETDIAKFCEVAKVEAIPDITVAQFPKIIAQLETKKRRMAK